MTEPGDQTAAPRADADDPAEPPELPLPIMVIAGFLVISATITIPTKTMDLWQPRIHEMVRDSLPELAQIGLMYARLIVDIVAGIGIFRGLAWARRLYVTVTPVCLGLSLLTSPMRVTLIPGAIIYVIITVALFVGAAGRHFKPPPNPETAS